jgi:hypothetical protein
MGLSGLSGPVDPDPDPVRMLEDEVELNEEI